MSEHPIVARILRSNLRFGLAGIPKLGDEQQLFRKQGAITDEPKALAAIRHLGFVHPIAMESNPIRLLRRERRLREKLTRVHAANAGRGRAGRKPRKTETSLRK